MVRGPERLQEAYWCSGGKPSMIVMGLSPVEDEMGNSTCYLFANSPSSTSLWLEKGIEGGGGYPKLKDIKYLG